MIDPRSPDFENTPVSERRPEFHYRAAHSLSRPSVTIVTPFFNTGEVFHETAKSVLGQSFQQWRWIIINDGSTDPVALDVLRHYRRADPRIEVLDQTNRGPGAARNTGFRMAETEYVLQLDSDDLLEPTAMEKWVWYLETHPEMSFVKGFEVGFQALNYLWQDGFHSGAAFTTRNMVQVCSIVRRSVHQIVGGYDESIRGGLEDWDFWLRCANEGFWGGTTPEFLSWYRRRPSHNDTWETWDEGPKERAFRERLKEKYPRLWEPGGFPEIREKASFGYDFVARQIPLSNPLGKVGKRVLVLVPWMAMGGSDRFALDLIAQLTHRDWEVTVCATLEGSNPWLPECARYTPDIFALPRFLNQRDFPVFVRYLMESRAIDLVLITHSEFGYINLPYLRAHCPSVTFVDYTHIVEDEWYNGGFPRLSAEFQNQLDLCIVSSASVKQWMVDRAAEPDRIEVCYTGIDPELWAPDPIARQRVRGELGIPEDATVILYAARLCEQKQPKVFAHVMDRIRKGGKPFRAIVAGDGPEFDWLNEFIAAEGLGSEVQMLGAVAMDDMPGVMAASDILFLPSKNEGIALTLFEAMSCGLAIVATDVGGQRELIPESAGILLPAGEDERAVELFSAALEELIGSPDQARAWGRRARSRVLGDFRLENMGRRMLELFHRAEELHAADPRASVGIDLANALGTQAVECLRVKRLMDQFWHAMKTLERDVENQARILLESQAEVEKLTRYWQKDQQEIERLSRSLQEHQLELARVARAWRESKAVIAMLESESARMREELGVLRATLSRLPHRAVAFLDEKLSRRPRIRRAAAGLLRLARRLKRQLSSQA